MSWIYIPPDLPRTAAEDKAPQIFVFLLIFGLICSLCFIGTALYQLADAIDRSTTEKRERNQCSDIQITPDWDSYARDY